MNCTELEELVGAYVLDAVTPEEREAVEAHLAHCPRCTKLVQEMRETIGLLPLGIQQVEPSTQLKGRILAAVQAEASQAKQRPTVAPPLLTLPLKVPEMERPVVPQVRRPRSRVAAAQRWALPLVAAAAVFFLLVSGGLALWGVSLQQQVAGLQASTITTTTYAITGTKDAPGVTGEARHLSGKGLDVTIVTLRGLPSLQGQQVYQGWELQGKETKSVGLMTAQGDGEATISIPGDVKGNDAVAVSLEKGPGATPNAPQGKVLAVGKIT